MDDTKSGPMTLVQPLDLGAAIQQYMVEVDQALANMQRDQAEIETLKAESKQLLAETRAILSTLVSGQPLRWPPDLERS